MYNRDNMVHVINHTVKRVYSTGGCRSQGRRADHNEADGCL